MSDADGPDDRAPTILRYGLPIGALAAFLALVIAAAFTGTADWGLAIPIGLIIGGAAVASVWLALRRRGWTATTWIDDYWSRED